MKIYLIAGEASGDLHASNLIKSLKLLHPDAEFRGWGGDLMQSAGMELVRHYRDTAVMGLINVILKLRSIGRNIQACKKDIESWKPDLMIFVDYPGFNLRIAEFTKTAGITNYYYIAPKVWASREKRVEKIRKYIDKIFAILPFEENYFSKHGITVEYVGSPVVDALEDRTCKNEKRSEFIQRIGLENKPIIALLAGSRQHEVTQILPYFLRIATQYPQYQYVVAGVSVLDRSVYNSLIESAKVKLVFDETYALLQHAEVALVASGTATLETALLNVPQVVCYRLWGNNITQFVMNRIVKVPWVSLVNLIMHSEVVKELIQKKLTDDTLKLEFENLVQNKDYRTKMLKDYKELQNIVGGPGASERAAAMISRSFTESIKR
ncbi:lipid-A-disaccharide synthase [Saccharicrinis sp. FJH62]|uniref:lipid-A-disaccharide synthase n=1 Tax=Saccharicrinis sp. FJH62 TaxID=3344657 RepID=UPI0035D47ECD